MEARSLRIGDVVKLVSGGPLITIEDIIRNHNRVGGVWFAGDELQRGVFSPDTLVIQIRDNYNSAE